MASSSSSSGKSQSIPLHNFELPELWAKNGDHGSLKKRRHPIMPLLRRQNAPSAFLLPHRPILESVSALQPGVQSPLRDSAAPSSHDCLIKQSPVHKESMKPSRNSEGLKKSSVFGDSEKLPLPPQGESCKVSLEGEEYKISPTGDDSEKLALPPRRESGKASQNVEHFKSPPLVRNSEKLPLLRRQFHRRPSVWEVMNRGKDGAIEHRTNPAFANSSLKNWVTGKAERKEKRSTLATEGDGAAHKMSKILIKIPSKSNKEDGETSKEGPMKIGNKDDGEVKEKEEDFDDETSKIRDLRPRKAKCSKSQKAAVKGEKGNSGGGGGSEKKGKGKEKIEEEESEKKLKLGLSVALTKEEIEEDIYAMTGKIPARRPKRRAKNVQKQLDVVFPGLWLTSITPESYSRR